MTKLQAAKLFTTLQGAFPAAVTSEMTPRVYETHLLDLDAAHCLRAIDHLIDTSRFFPTIAEIRELTLTLDPKARPLSRDEAPPLPPSCRRWLQLIPNASGVFYRGEADDGWWYEFQGHLPVRTHQVKALLGRASK